MAMPAFRLLKFTRLFHLFAFEYWPAAALPAGAAADRRQPRALFHAAVEPVRTK